MTRSTCPLPAGAHVWAYLRVSGDEQADRGLPIAGQRQRAQEYADHHQLILSRWFIDEARSGGSTVHRDAFNEMIDQARAKPRPVDGLLVWDLKRFARNLQDSQFYKADLRRRGYTLIFLSDEIPETDFAPVYEAILEWKAEKDRADIAKDIQRSLHLLARMGYAPGGYPPRGYKAESVTVEVEGRNRQVRRWVPDPQWWDVARRAWDLRADGASLDTVLATTHLYRTTNALTSFYRNKTYLGYRLCGDLEVPDAHQPLISRETWDKVQSRRTSHGPGRKGQPWPEDHPRRSNSTYLLSGLLYCGECGAAMIGARQAPLKRADGWTRREWRYYICGRRDREGLSACPSGKLKAQVVESAVLKAVLEQILTVERLEELQDATNAALEGRRDELVAQRDQLQRQRRQLDATITRLVDAIETEDSPALRERLRERESERLRIDSQTFVLDDRLRRTKLTISHSALAQLATDLATSLHQSDITANRRLLASIVLRIEATRQGGLLYYTFPFATGV